MTQKITNYFDVCFFGCVVDWTVFVVYDDVVAVPVDD
jgi:hypothetical protein